MSKYDEYWQEAFENALYEMDLGHVVESLTPEQRAELQSATLTPEPSND